MVLLITRSLQMAAVGPHGGPGQVGIQQKPQGESAGGQRVKGFLFGQFADEA
jgi:hypothetical protein